MTVVVQCFHCNAILELDEGFRGGVCRCSACGSLLQVPKAQDVATSAPAKKIRPDIPPAPVRRGPPANGIASDAFPNSPIGSSGFAADYGGSSSGLGRIHKTRPVAGPSSRKKPLTQDEPPPSDSLTPTNAPPPPRPPAHGIPEIRAARDNRILFWIGIALIFFIAAVAITLVALYMSRQEPHLSPRSRTIPAPALAPAPTIQAPPTTAPDVTPPVETPNP